MKLPADLVISCSNLIAGKNTKGETFIKATVEVKNLGQTASMPATIRGLIGTNPEKKTVTTPVVHFSDNNKPMDSWKFCMLDPGMLVGVIGPGM